MSFELVSDLLIAAAALYCMCKGVFLYSFRAAKGRNKVGASTDAALHAILAVICIGALL
jgi:hypothetical protein